MLKQIFSTREREKILIFLAKNPSKIYKVRETSRALKISVGAVSRFFILLARKGILKKRNNGYYLNTLSPLTKAVKVLINLNYLDSKLRLLRKIPNVKGIGLYGSFADGTNKEDSDVDIWIKVEEKVDESKVAKVSARLNKKLKREVSLLIVDPAKNKRLKKEDPVFYYSLAYSSILLWGEKIED